MQVRALLEWVALGLENSDEPLKFSGHYTRINLSESRCTMEVWLFPPLTDPLSVAPAPILISNSQRFTTLDKAFLYDRLLLRFCTASTQGNE